MSSEINDTNLHPDLLANSDRIVSEDRRIKVSDLPKQSDEDDNFADELNSYKRQHNDNVEDRRNDEPHNEDEEFHISKEDVVKEKMQYIMKLGELKSQGIKISQDYNIQSSLKSMKFEYDLLKSRADKMNALSWTSGMLVNLIRGLELLNDNYSPFGIKFNYEWSSDVNKNIRQYYAILGDIYDKYTTPGKPISPELKLCFTLLVSSFNIIGHKFISKHVEDMAKQINENPGFFSNLVKQAENDRVLSDVNPTMAPLDPETKQQYEEINKQAAELRDLKPVNTVKQQQINSMKEQLRLSESSKMSGREERKSLSRPQLKEEENKKLMDVEKNLQDIDSALEKMNKPKKRKYPKKTDTDEETASTISISKKMSDKLNLDLKPEKVGEKDSDTSKGSGMTSKMSHQKGKGFVISMAK
jgi:hypothetical protein